jgi:hypothetical protein
LGASDQWEKLPLSKSSQKSANDGHSGVHAPLEQMSPAVHDVPPQQACPLPPHAQVPDAHVKLGAQVAPAQHGCPDAPHGAHAALAQAKPVLHEEPPQHGCRAPPQDVHSPSAQVRPLAQRAPWQHACPSAPQGTHTPVSVHTRPAAQCAPPQHAWPSAPQVHTDATQLRLAPQVSPAQHA